MNVLLEGNKDDRFRQHCMYPTQYDAVIDLITIAEQKAGRPTPAKYAVNCVHATIHNLMTGEPSIAYASVGGALAVRVSMRLDSNYFRQVVLAFQPV